jgi:hypothetical protein
MSIPAPSSGKRPDEFSAVPLLESAETGRRGELFRQNRYDLLTGLDGGSRGL